MKKCKQQLKTSGEQIFEIDFHPTANVLAMATISGLVEIVQYGVENKSPVLSVKLFDASCRGLVFSEDGNTLYTISSDKSMKAINGGGQVIFDIPNAHDASINKIAAVNNLSSGSAIIVTGDDVGRVNTWDFRAGATPVMTWKLHDDYISDFCYHSTTQTLFSTSGDACMGVYDFKKKDNSMKSFTQEAELLSVEVIKNGRKVVCGTDGGNMLIFSWGKWEHCLDSYPDGHPEAINDMLKVDENTVFTGCEDGKVRAVSVHPNKVLGVVGDHGYFPVEGMRRSNDGRMLGTYAHENKVRLWDISIFAEDEDDAVDEEPDGNSSSGMEGAAVAAEGEDVEMEDGDEGEDEGEDEEEGPGDEWDDASDSDEDDDDDDNDMAADEDSDDSDDSDEVAVKTGKKGGKGGKAAAGAGSGNKNNKFGKKGGGFYDGL
jgi:WD40 repeat protein